VVDTLFTAADITEMRAFSDANLPDTVVLRRGVRTRVSGGSYSAAVWDAGATWTEPCRVSPASAPQEKLSSGSIAEIRDFWVVTRHGVTIPKDESSGATTQNVYRLEWTHGITGVPSPFLLYYRGAPLRSYRMESKHLCSSV
jgi:hypothetical protein